MIEGRGIANTPRVFSPDGRKVAYISSGKNPYMSLSSLYVMDVEKGGRKRIKTGVSTQPAFTHDGRLVYAKKTRTSRGSHFYDLYVYDMDKRKEKRLTRTLRARDPACSPDGRVVFVVEADGTANLVTLDLKEINRPLSSGSGALRQVTSFSQGEQIFTPEWLDGERIVFSLAVEKEGRDIAAIDTDGGDFEILLGKDGARRH